MISAGQFHRRTGEQPATIEPTLRVPAKLGVAFGIILRFAVTPDDRPARMRQIVRLPEPAPRQSSVTLAYSFETQFDVEPGQVVARGYVLEKDSDLKAGEWSFEIWDGADKLLVQSFTVYVP